MTKFALVNALRMYFAKLGYMPTYAEYLALEDKPYRPHIIKRMLGSWARVEKMIGPLDPVIEKLNTVPDKPVEKAPIEKKPVVTKTDEKK